MVLGFMCLFNELFYAALYLLYFTPGPICKSNFVSFSSGNFKFYCMEFGIWNRETIAHKEVFLNYKTLCEKKSFDLLEVN